MSAKAPAAQGSGAVGARSTARISEAVRRSEDIKNAGREEPLLGSPGGNARRGAVLAQVGAELEGRNGPEYAHAAGLVRAMRPNSVAEAWDGLHLELERLKEPALAEAVAMECRQARGEAWQSMKSDGDVISQLVPMGEQFASSHASSVSRYRQKIASMAAHTRPFRLGPEMEDHVVDMARFGSMADDWMTRVVIDELYLTRGMYGEVVSICGRILGFRGHDRHKMMASTLVEDMLGALLAHLERCESAGYVDGMASRGMPISPRCKEKGHREGLALECLRALERRAEILGLEIRPRAAGGSVLRRASDYALKVRARITIPGAGEIVRHVRENYPESYAFLGLDDPGVAERAAKGQVPLVEGIPAQAGTAHTAGAQGGRRPASEALEALERMLRFKRESGTGVRPGTLQRWRAEILGEQLRACLFEMGVYLRLVRAGAEVETDAGAPAGRGDGAGAGLRVDGCMAGVYTPLDRGVLAHGRAARIENPDDALVDRVVMDAQTRDMGGNRAVAIVNCPGGELGNAEALRERMEARLVGASQPGAVFLVRNGSGPRAVACLVNSGAAAAVPEETLRTIQGALELESL